MSAYSAKHPTAETSNTHLKFRFHFISNLLLIEVIEDETAALASEQRNGSTNTEALVVEGISISLLKEHLRAHWQQRLESVGS